MAEKLKGLFVNTAKANCSIHESGKMCYDCLILSTEYTIDYQEVSQTQRSISLDYDFYVFNYHAVTMGWLDVAYVKNLPGFKATIVLEILPNNPFVMCREEDFDAFVVLDPTLQSVNPKVYKFPRPLEDLKPTAPYIEKLIPEVGTFGFATSGKGFDKVIDAVNREFDEAIVKINIPSGDYVPQADFDKLIGDLSTYPTKEGVKVLITNNFLDKQQLIDWCTQNTINVFLYNRNIAGLSATTDQAITSGRPLVVSADNTFRHIHQYIKPYPFQSLKEAITNTGAVVSKIQKDWAPLNFAHRFENVLKDNNVKPGAGNQSDFLLPVKTETQQVLQANGRFKLKDFVPPILIKAYKKLTRTPQPVMQQITEPALQPFVHYALNSFSQFNEDLLLDLLLGQKQQGFYLDVGANDPSFNSNTKRFYDRGWHGINIEPNFIAFNNIKNVRHRDVNLNLAISDHEGELVFYYLGNDSTLSTLDRKTAEKMALMLNLDIISQEVKTNSLANILDEQPAINQIDFMSVDAEGHDLAVLKSNNWHKYRPDIVMIESNNEFSAIRPFMDSNDYLHIFSNYYNAIFVNKRTTNATLLKTIKWEL